MNTLEANSIRIGKTCGEILGINILLNVRVGRARAANGRAGTRFRTGIPFDIKPAKVLPDGSTAA